MTSSLFKKALAATSLSVATLFAPTSFATIVQFQTSLGDFQVNLYDEKTPNTVANFLAYVEAGAYKDSIIHRSMPGFVVQGGGFGWTEDNKYTTITSNAAVVNEPVFSNVKGTIAMAKLGNNPNSATNQWFFNMSNNSGNLDVQNGGFTAFGETDTTGMTILAAINALETFNKGGAFTDMPLRDYTSNTTVTDENVVMIYDIVVLDATVNTLGTKAPKENTLIKNVGTVNTNSGGGALPWQWLALAAGLVFARRFARRA